MPRGTKTCPKCKTQTGPRAFKCPNCQELFLIKGKTIDRPPITAGYKRVDEEKNEILFDIADFFDVVPDYEKDEVNLRCYDGTAQCWQSRDDAGEYRLRFAKTFMGIAIPDERPYVIIKRTRAGNNTMWVLVSRHKRLQSALKSFDRIAKGLPPVKTRKELKAERRIEKFMKKAGKI